MAPKIGRKKENKSAVNRQRERTDLAVASVQDIQEDRKLRPFDPSVDYVEWEEPEYIPERCVQNIADSGDTRSRFVSLSSRYLDVSRSRSHKRQTTRPIPVCSIY